MYKHIISIPNSSDIKILLKKDFQEPLVLQQDRGKQDYDEIQKILEKDLSLLLEALSEHENHQQLFEQHYSTVGQFMSNMQEIQQLLFEEFERNQPN